MINNAIVVGFDVSPSARAALETFAPDGQTGHPDHIAVLGGATGTLDRLDVARPPCPGLGKR